MDLEENAFLDMDTAVPLGIIVNELVSNSLKHAFPDRDKGEIQIKLQSDENKECKTESCKSTNFTLTVSDNGVGIPPEDLKKIFNPFFTSRKEDGFGLGLFISKIIVEKHHGTLSASSNVGKGTVMSAGFPVEEASASSGYKLINREK